MKINVLFALASLMLFASCSRGVDLYQDPENKTSEEDINNNVKGVFGVDFASNQDWCTTTSGELTILADASVSKVQLLVKVREVYDDVPSYVTRDVMKLLNEAEVKGQTTFKMSYDAPKENLGFYVAFITDKGNVYKKVKGNTVSVEEPARTRTLSADYNLPSGDFKLANAIESYANQRGWVENEMLYELSDEDYGKLKMSSPDYSDGFKKSFRDIVFSVFPNGRDYRNLSRVIESGYYNKKIYPITTGDEPIIVTPVYKCDNPLKYGNEVWNSDLYYYYYKADANIGATAADSANYFNSLPKYKAIPFNQTFGEEEDDSIMKHGSFALLYFQDGKPSVGENGTVGTFQFPKGYKIGFMIRAKTTSDGKKKQGEVYGDGCLNGHINTDTNYNFRSSKLGATDPRATWLNINNRMMLTWESGTDADFNDIILEVEGGIEDIIVPPPFTPQMYTYCFEDTELGDYDMNDVVIKALRLNETTIEYRIVACGAHDELYVKNLNYGDIKEGTEVHELFGTTPQNFVNTQNGDSYSFVVGTRTVDKNFKLSEEPDSEKPYIFNKTKNKKIYLSKAGEDPHGIIVAYDFHYPLERICIKDAYPQFNNWGENPINSTWWYMSPNPSKVYKN